MLFALATELRDAGFPNIQDVQHRQGREFVTPEGRVSVYSLGQIAPTQDWFIPTLEEIIVACGKEFEALRHDGALTTDDGSEWCADRIENGRIETHIGKTPTEAVARLWLALKKH
jgi:hypothetical protein